MYVYVFIYGKYSGVSVRTNRNVTDTRGFVQIRTQMRPQSSNARRIPHDRCEVPYASNKPEHIPDRICILPYVSVAFCGEEMPDPNPNLVTYFGLESSWAWVWT